MSQKEAASYKAWLCKLGVDFKTIIPHAKFKNPDISIFGRSKYTELVVGADGKLHEAPETAKSITVVVQKGLKVYKFYHLDEIRLWYTYCVTKHRHVQHHGSGSGCGYFNSSYFSRIPPHYRETFSKPTTGLPILRKAFEQYFAQNQKNKSPYDSIFDKLVTFLE
jgi:hypothetical protein